MTTTRSRLLLILGTLALVPLLLAITVGFPAGASPKTGAPPAVVIEEEPAPAGIGNEIEITIDTGVVQLGGGTAISALTLSSTTTIPGGN